MRPHPTLALTGFLAVMLCNPLLAHADTISVLGTSVVYAAGPSFGNQQFDAGQSGGTLPNAIAVTPGTYITFSVTGSVSVDGIHFTDADGLGGTLSSSTNNGFSGVSGISAPGAGYLTGVFTKAIGPNGPAPTSLNFTSKGLGTTFSTMSPLLDQQFFIGDGFTGDGVGTTQTFYVPLSATVLYLGISDTCSGTPSGSGPGGPSCYNNNLGQYSVTENLANRIAVTPEPCSLALFGTGLLGIAGLVRKRGFLNGSKPNLKQ